MVFSAAEKSSFGETKVLVVDDEYRVRKVIQGLLLALNCTKIHEARNGVEALEQIVVLAPDVVLLDWTLPDMTGPEFFRRLHSSLPAHVATAPVIMMDYTLYCWHVLIHRVPALWRFHAVHHVDLDMDASTALRFHFGEMAMSVPYRAAQVAMIGVSPRALSIWQALLFLSVMFHHSNVRLPRSFERWLVRFIVTPRMHVEGCWPVESGLQSTVPDRRVSRDRWRSHKRGLFA